MLKEFDHIPEGFLEASPTDLNRLLGGPSLISLSGKKSEPLFISVLQHGNEHTGLEAIQRILEKYQNKALPRSLEIFIGNVAAADHHERRLDDQVDYNRVWPGHQYGNCEEATMMRYITDKMCDNRVFASIDIHNNTGLNPHYACINKMDPQFIYLATLFSRTIVYFTRPLGVQSLAFADFCPSLTVECGLPGQQYGEQHAIEFIETCMALTALPTHDLPSTDYNVYSMVAIVRLSKDISFSFRSDEADILLNEDLDFLNFRELKPGTKLGVFKGDGCKGIEVWNNEGKNVVHDYFDFEKNEIRFSKLVMPSMFTSNEHIIRQDCLCYLMERYKS